MPRLPVSLALLAPLLLAAMPASAQTTEPDASTEAAAPVWDLGSLEQGKTYPTTVTAQNVSCRGRHTFEVAVEDAPWLRVTGPSRLERIAVGESETTAALVDLRGVDTGDHRGAVVVRCVTCPPPPACNLSARRTEIRVTVREPATGTDTGDEVEEPAPPETTGADEESQPDATGPETSDRDTGPAGGSAAGGRPPEEDREQLIGADECQLSGRKRQEYSRGQNNYDQMKRQAELTGTGRLVYETARMTAEWSADSRCECVQDERGDTCRGEIDVRLRLRITGLDAGYAPVVTGKSLVPVAPPEDGAHRTRETDRAGGPEPEPNELRPRPNVRVHAPDSYRHLPAAANPFQADGEDFHVAASTTIPCTAGTHAVRFLVLDSDVLERKAAWRRSHRVTPGKLQFFADANLTVTQDDCEMQLVEIEGFLLEFFVNAEFPTLTYRDQKGQPVDGDPRAELPRLEHVVDGRRGATRSLLKLIRDGEGEEEKVDDPYPPKHKRVPADD